jgi:hypothetical protein
MHEMYDADELFTTKEAAKILQIPPSQVSEHRRLRLFKLKGTGRIAKFSLEELLIIKTMEVLRAAHITIHEDHKLDQDIVYNNKWLSICISRDLLREEIRHEIGNLK